MRASHLRMTHLVATAVGPAADYAVVGLVYGQILTNDGRLLITSAEVFRDLHFNPLRVVAEGGPGGFDHWALLPHYLLYVALLSALHSQGQHAAS